MIGASRSTRCSGWVPLGIGINVEVPPFDGGGGGGAGEIVDGRFDGAFLGGLSASKGHFRIDADLVWAAVGGDRLELPRLTVDADLIYGHGMVGFMVAPDWYRHWRRPPVRARSTTSGSATSRTSSASPGVWDPLDRCRLAPHRQQGRLARHLRRRRLRRRRRCRPWRRRSGSTGGRSRTSASPAGYNFLYFKVSDAVRERDFTVKQTLHGPLLGIGFYF